MLEEQHKRLWCPMIRLENATVSYHDKRDSEPGRTAAYLATCIASRCAMWRWTNHPANCKTYIPDADPMVTDEPDRPQCVPASWKFYPANHFEEGEPACWMQPQDEADAAGRHGCCGLAGNPLPFLPRPRNED